MPENLLAKFPTFGTKTKEADYLPATRGCTPRSVWQGFQPCKSTISAGEQTESLTSAKLGMINPKNAEGD